MFDSVRQGFKNARLSLSNKRSLTEEDIDAALGEIRLSLLEADVEFGVVKTFLAAVKEKALGEVVKLEAGKGKKKKAVRPGDHFTYICLKELETLMGPADTELELPKKMGSIMMVGLQGSGKTTTTGKIARRLKAEGKKPMLVAADIYRPAAVEQLKTVGEQVGVPVYHRPGGSALEQCVEGFKRAQQKGCNVVLFDTAGRLAIDDTLMLELEQIKAAVEPNNILLVVDAMIGQDAVRTAAEFNRRLEISGFCLTKLDGDARGGSAISIKAVTGKPIKFLGVGETSDKLEVFRPEGLAQRILGMGDIGSLMADFEDLIDEDEAEADAKKLLSGQFTLDDFIKQIDMIGKMGSLSSVMERMPGMDEMTGGQKIDDRMLVRMKAMIQSMTKAEKADPEVINASRRERIAKGSGHKPKEVGELVKRFAMMKQMMGVLGTNPGLLGNLPGFKQMAAMKKMQGMDPAAMFGDMLGTGGGGGQQTALPPGVPRGFTPPGFQGGAAPQERSNKERNKAKAKRKAAKKARKKKRK
jgi:signal recognition particle subunit SRP54